MRRILFTGTMVAVIFVGACSQPDGQLVRSRLGQYRQDVQEQLLADASQPPQAARADARLLRHTQVRSDAIEDQPAWLAALGESDAAPSQADQAPAGESASVEPVHWKTRRGPAYPGDFWHSFGRDAKEFPSMLLDDAKATVTQPVPLVALALAGASGIAINGSGADNKVAEHYERNGHQLNGFWDSVGDVGGNPATHFAVAGAAYLVSLHQGDTKTYEVSKTMLSALSITGIYTVGLKAAVRTDSPNGDHFGWPSGHTSSSVAFATVAWEAYGPLVGVPLMGFAAYVGYERIDARNHDFSDVISGALIGFAVGHAVSRNHQAQIFGMTVVPYVDPRGGSGLALMKQFK